MEYTWTETRTCICCKREYVAKITLELDPDYICDKCQVNLSEFTSVEGVKKT